MPTRADKYTQTSKKEVVFSDFFVNFDMHPLNGSIARLTNEDAVKQSVKNLLLTNIYERFYQPTVGSRIYSLLFELPTEMTSALMEELIADCINQHEPRVSINDIDVYIIEDRNEYNVNIKLLIKTTLKEIQVNLILKRTR